MSQPLSPIVRSALWAAWGDALGFQTELVSSEQQLQRRLGTGRVETTGAWSRRIGGRFGVQVDLPAGTYSDDTQLRLAVCRCIRASGRFDVEALSKIELSVFPSYGLGAGIGTTTAAKALGKRSVRWNSNFFSSERSTYIDGGGNGAAMRIQPHVWASRELRPADYLSAVIRDAVITHGHPRGILGAVLHALAMGSVLRENAIPEPARWVGMVEYLGRVPKMMADDDALAERWIPMWERQSNRSWSSAVLETIEELLPQVQIAATEARRPREAEPELYADLCEKLGGLSPKTRGSGTIAAILSLWLAWRHQNRPSEGLCIAANLIGSDTDTIATMVGALVGPLADEPLPGPLLDYDLHSREAGRLKRLRAGEPVEDFPHPDPLRWQQPATLSDAVGLMDGKLALMGLGAAEPDGEMRLGKDHTGWQWLVTNFDEHVLVKRREDLADLPEWSHPRHRATAKAEQLLVHPQQQLETEPTRTPLDRGKQQELPDEIEDAVEQVVAAGFKQELFVQMFLKLSHQPYGVTKTAIFASMVAERLRSNDQLAPTANGTVDARSSKPQISLQRTR